MSDQRFFDEAGKRRVRDAVRAIEQVTAAEVVVAVRKRSWRYRHTYYLVGFVTALLLLIALLYLPQTFDIKTWPLEIGGAFVGGALLCSVLAPLERLLTEPAVMASQVARAATLAFVTLGITRTRGRTGLLVYLSLAERRAHLVADIGLDPLKHDQRFAAACTAIQTAAAAGDFDAFVAAIGRLGAPLGSLLPREADDQNELSDEAA